VISGSFIYIQYRYWMEGYDSPHIWNGLHCRSTAYTVLIYGSAGQSRIWIGNSVQVTPLRLLQREGRNA
jgi:hypothetical protein